MHYNLASGRPRSRESDTGAAGIIRSSKERPAEVSAGHSYEPLLYVAGSSYLIVQ